MSTAQAPIQPYQLTPFGLVRVGAPFLLADLVNKYQVDSNFWGTLLTGTGAITHVAAQSAISVKAGAGAGTALLQTHEYYRYQAGKATRWLMTGYSSDAGNAANVREWGQFDTDNGIFFRHARSTVGNKLDIVIRSKVSGAVVETVIAQNAWNQNATTVAALDPTKGNIYEVAYEWLGVGNIQFWINGTLVHVQANANTIAGPYMTTAQLPMAVFVTDTASGSATGWTSICTSAYSEGGDMPAQYGFAYVRAGAPFAFATAETPLLSIRPANLVNGIANRTLVLPHHASIAAGNFSSANNTATFKFYLNSVLTTGLAWTAVGGGSNVERDVDTTAGGFAAGTLIEEITLGEGDQVVFPLEPLFSVHGRKLIRRDLAAITQDILTVTATLSAGTGSGSCALVWGETA